MLELPEPQLDSIRHPLGVATCRSAQRIATNIFQQRRSKTVRVRTYYFINKEDRSQSSSSDQGDRSPRADGDGETDERGVPRIRRDK